jgi:DNA-binding NarL/FixJ family response regulator
VSELTLLFTDIEGSTRLVQELGPRYVTELGRHRRLVRDEVAAHGGAVIDCRGDEFAIRFARPQDALAAASAIQRRHDEGMRVRIGLHTGSPLRVDDGYVGIDMHRAARICAAGHGGQILVSETTRNRLPDAAGLRDLGFHRLRGLADVQQVYQVGDGEFPALRAEADCGLGTPMRVVLADDAVLLREGVARLLTDAGFDVVGQSGNADDLLELVARTRPHVAIVDIRMPPTHTDEGLRAAEAISERHPDTGVLLLSQYVESGYAQELVTRGAHGVGYLLKDRVTDVEEFVSAVRRVGDGGSALDPAVVAMLLGRRRRDDPLRELSPRERTVLELMAEGLSNGAIAARTQTSERTVTRHVTSIFGKLRLPPAGDGHRRVLAVLALLRA